MRRLELLTLAALAAAVLAAGCGQRLDPRAQEGYDLVVEGRIGEAMAFVNAVLADEPDNAQVRNVLGLALYKSGDTEGSIRQYLEALEDDSKLAEAWFNLGNSHNLLRNTAEAESAFVKAVRHQKKFTLARYNLGMIYKNSGRPAPALEQFRAVVEIDPQFYPAFLEIGLHEMAAGDTDVGIAAFTRVLELAPRFKEVRVHLGNALLGSAKEDAAELAEKEFRAAVGIDPQYVDGLYSLGVALASQGRQEEAVREFDKVYRMTAAVPAHDAVHRQVKAYFEEIGYTPPDSSTVSASS
ncbi:MAG: tetratricopeptide repeat protein [Candidatus Eiseniibacteriota bacterium]